MNASKQTTRLTDQEVATFWTQRLEQLGRATSLDLKGLDTLLKLWNERVRISHHKYAIECLGHSLTFGEVDELAQQIAAYLIERPFLNRGDRVAVMLPNLAQYIPIVLGILKAGLVVVNCNPLYTTREIEFQLNNSESKVLFTLVNVAQASSQANTPKLQEVVLTEVGDLLPLPKRWIVNAAVRYVKRMIPPYRFPSHLIIHSFRSLLRTPSASALVSLKDMETSVSPEDVAFLQYTGGTTGISKGAILSHYGMVCNIEQSMRGLNQDLERKPIEMLEVPGPINSLCLHPLPFYHVYGLMCCLLTSAAGGAGTVTLPNPRELDAVIKLLQRRDILLMTSINTLLKGILTHPKVTELNLAKDFVVVAGGMATSPDVSKEWFEKTKTPITEGYGLTEASPLLTLVDPRHPRSGVAGYALTETLLKLRDEDGNDLPLGAGPEVRGELLAKGPQIMRGYFRNPEETARVMSDDGFLMTGDIATIAADGLIEIVDRKKDMILVSGFNVYPNEVEARALETGLLLECAAIGVADSKTGEKVVLYAVPLNPSLTVEALAEKLRQTLTNYKRPAEIIFVESLPKSAVGKILRREVRTLAKQKLPHAS